MIRLLKWISTLYLRVRYPHLFRTTYPAWQGLPGSPLNKAITSDLLQRAFDKMKEETVTKQND